LPSLSRAGLPHKALSFKAELFVPLGKLIVAGKIQAETSDVMALNTKPVLSPEDMHQFKTLTARIKANEALLVELPSLRTRLQNA
jgi:predicted RNase H-like nuclease (RuvC/YqgF family)